MRLAGTFLFSVLAIAAGADAKIFGKDKREFWWDKSEFGDVNC